MSNDETESWKIREDHDRSEIDFLRTKVKDLEEQVRVLEAENVRLRKWYAGVVQAATGTMETPPTIFDDPMFRTLAEIEVTAAKLKKETP